MSREPTASFSLGRKWSLSLSVLVGSLAVVALVVMTNYLAARRYQRFNLSLAAQIRLSSQTQRLVAVEFRDSLPRSTIGKIMKRELRAPYWEGRTAKI